MPLSATNGDVYPGFGHWLPASMVQVYQRGPLAPWLCHPGSLTARLVVHSEGEFRVQVLRQGWGRATVDEARLLGISPRARVLVREVILQGRGEPWVWARSILPQSSMTGSLRSLSTLKDQPLGGWLFRQPSLRRGPMQISRYQAGPDKLPAFGSAVNSVAGSVSLWGRRSLFFVEEKPVLVAEVFLPDFVDTLR